MLPISGHRNLLALVPSAALLLSGMIACGGSSSENPPLLTLSGTARDYFTDVPVGGVTLTIEELPLTGTGQNDGSYTIADIPRNSILTVTAAAANYRPTRNDTIQFGTASVLRPVQVIAAADVARQYSLLSLTATAGTAIVIATLTDNGVPLENVPLADMTLRDAGMSPVGDGPFIIGATGDVDPALAVSTAFGGRSRVAFLNVPPGLTALSVTLAGPVPTTRVANLITTTNGATLVAP